jgi:hypothetical protein
VSVDLNDKYRYDHREKNYIRIEQYDYDFFLSCHECEAYLDTAHNSKELVGLADALSDALRIPGNEFLHCGDDNKAKEDFSVGKPAEDEDRK